MRGCLARVRRASIKLFPCARRSMCTCGYHLGKHMSHLLDQARADMERAKNKAQDLRRRYNAAADDYNAAKARYDRLAFIAFEEELKLASERKRAEAEGNHALAVLLANG